MNQNRRTFLARISAWFAAMPFVAWIKRSVEPSVSVTVCYAAADEGGVWEYHFADEQLIFSRWHERLPFHIIA